MFFAFTEYERNYEMTQAATRSRQEMSDVLEKIDDYNLELFRALVRGTPAPARPELPRWAAWDGETAQPDQGFRYLSTDTNGANYQHLPQDIKGVFAEDRAVATEATKAGQQKTQRVVDDEKQRPSSREERRKRLEAIDDDNLETLRKQQKKSREELLNKLDDLEKVDKDKARKVGQDVTQARKQTGGFFAELLAEVSTFLKNLIDKIVQEVKEFFQKIGTKIVDFFKDLFGL